VRDGRCRPQPPGMTARPPGIPGPILRSR
jgi:hypothetical protein